jgi:anaerobic selenocysteine-containing dehydrogenase
VRDPKTIQTEVFLLPAAFFMEKNGTITNSARTRAVAQRGGQAAGKACRR